MSRDHADSVKRGRRGEELVCEYLTGNGYTILKRNFHAPHGEIDIIASDSVYIVFAEVKTRRRSAVQKRYGRPAAAVDYNKKAHIISAVQHYIRSNPTNLKPRIDVIEVYTDENTTGILTGVDIKHYKNAFGADAAALQ